MAWYSYDKKAPLVRNLRSPVAPWYLVMPDPPVWAIGPASIHGNTLSERRGAASTGDDCADQGNQWFQQQPSTGNRHGHPSNDGVPPAAVLESPWRHCYNRHFGIPELFLCYFYLFKTRVKQYKKCISYNMTNHRQITIYSTIVDNFAITIPFVLYETFTNKLYKRNKVLKREEKEKKKQLEHLRTMASPVGYQWRRHSPAPIFGAFSYSCPPTLFIVHDSIAVAHRWRWG